MYEKKKNYGNLTLFRQGFVTLKTRFSFEENGVLFFIAESYGVQTYLDTNFIQLHDSYFI